ncbi:DarT1-associated NADAR antitoxin family protein [Tabrizicola flagellatus]|uniref:DarT1-associated NADAR antitoxin family protein n=1 Tax=Tabrizicola flagellatus TaxID=2593021 RepID=UPI0011F27D1C
MVAFTWHPGLSLAQKRRNVEALHAAALLQLKLSRPPLEVSTKSKDELGVSLSAFNLLLPDSAGREMPVECWFQSAKKFQSGGPFADLRYEKPSAAKADPRLKSSGQLLCFVLDGEVWPLAPPPSFYDWLYLRALNRNQSTLARIAEYPAFTDIEFNPAVSVNCQAHSVALAVALGDQINDLESPRAFQQRFSDRVSFTHPVQLPLL